MKELTIGAVAKAANISVRTLRHYDAIGLLKPASRTESGYRYYTEADLETLHDILTYRALGMALSEISKMLTEPSSGRLSMLSSQKTLIDEHIARLINMRAEIEITLKNEEAGMTMDNRFSALDGFDPDQYEEEAKERWGQTDAYKESAKRTKNYSKEDWARYKAEQDRLNKAMAELVRQQVSPDDQKATNLAESLRLLIDQWFYPCSREMHAQLGDMYVMDARFEKTYEDIYPGLAEYMKRAIDANLNRSIEKG